MNARVIATVTGVSVDVATSLLEKFQKAHSVPSDRMDDLVQDAAMHLTQGDGGTRINLILFRVWTDAARRKNPMADDREVEVEVEVEEVDPLKVTRLDYDSAMMLMKRHLPPAKARIMATYLSHPRSGIHIARELGMRDSTAAFVYHTIAEGVAILQKHKDEVLLMGMV
mgnify:FL=1